MSVTGAWALDLHKRLSIDSEFCDSHKPSRPGFTPQPEPPVGVTRSVQTDSLAPEDVEQTEGQPPLPAFATPPPVLSPRGAVTMSTNDLYLSPRAAAESPRDECQVAQQNTWDLEADALHVEDEGKSWSHLGGRETCGMSGSSHMPCISRKDNNKSSSARYAACSSVTSMCDPEDDGPEDQTPTKYATYGARPECDQATEDYFDKVAAWSRAQEAQSPR